MADRDYKAEASRESPERKKRRNERKRARYQLEKEGKVSRNDGKVVHHKKPLGDGGSNKKSNLAVQSKSKSNSEGGNRQPRSGKSKGGRN